MVNVRLNTRQLQNRIRRIQRNLRNMRPFFVREGSRIVYNELRRVFRTEGYGTWSPLNPDYANWKRQIAPGQPILQLSGAYFRAATTPNAQGSDSVAGIDNLQIGIDTSQFPNRYPELLERGTTRMPARPVYALVRQRVGTKVATALGDYVFRRRR